MDTNKQIISGIIIHNTKEAEEYAAQHMGPDYDKANYEEPFQIRKNRLMMEYQILKND